MPSRFDEGGDQKEVRDDVRHVKNVRMQKGARRLAEACWPPRGTCDDIDDRWGWVAIQLRRNDCGDGN